MAERSAEVGETFLETGLATDPSFRGQKVECRGLWKSLQKEQARGAVIKGEGQLDAGSRQ